MANPFSRFLSDRFIQPAVDAQVERALAKQPIAYGTTVVPDVSLAKSIGQPHDADYALLYALYKLNTDVSGSVHKWAGGVTGAGWRITTMDPDATITDALDKQVQEITRWLKNPNPYKLFESMLYEVVQHFGIVGDAFWYVTQDKNKRPLEIWPMHPALTKIIATKQGEVLGYVMKAPGEDPVTFTADEVLHFPLPNPTNDLYGESPLELVVEEAGIDLSALRSNKAIFQNGLNPSAIILLDETATPDQAKTITDQIKQSHTGAANQHKLIAVAKAKDFKPTTISPRDLEFLKLRDLATSKVTTAYRIPKVLLGHHNAGDYATTKFLIRDTYAHVYAPMQRLISEIITERLIHRFNPELRFELIRPDASDPDDIRKDQMQAKSEGILTADEVRADSFGKEPLEEKPESETPTDDDQAADTDAGDTAEAAPATKSVTKATGEPDDYDTLANERAAQLEQLSQEIQPAIGQFFTAQEQEYLERLGADLNARTLPSFLAATAAIQDTQLHALLFGLLVASLNAGSAAAQLQIGITLRFDQINPIVQEYLKDQALAHARGINTTTREALRAQLIEGIKAGEGIDLLTKRVEAVFTNAKGYRAQLIARAETAQAFEYANQAAMRATGVVARKQWLTAEDERVCVLCGPLNRAIAPLDGHFPNDVEPATIHAGCRCTTIGIVEEAA